MVRLRSIAGLLIAGICVWAWADASFANRAQDPTTPAEQAESLSPAVVDDVVPTPPAEVAVADTPEAVAGIGEITARLASLTADYQTGAVDCATTLMQIDQCVQTLDTQYLGCDAMPAWQDCRNQCVEFQATLPCCEETIISDVLISEEIIGETILEPIPMDQSCLPPCDTCSYGGSSCGGGCGGGGGGGFGGGGGLLGAGLGAAALAVGLADDDSSSGGYDGT